MGGTPHGLTLIQLLLFSPSFTWILILRGLVGGGMGGTPHG